MLVITLFYLSLLCSINWYDKDLAANMMSIFLGESVGIVMEYELIQLENNKFFLRRIDFTNVFTDFLLDGLLWHLFWIIELLMVVFT